MEQLQVRDWGSVQENDAAEWRKWKAEGKHNKSSSRCEVWDYETIQSQKTEENLDLRCHRHESNQEVNIH